MVELGAVCSQAGLDIAQALFPCELRKCHAQILIETREALDLVLAVVVSNTTPEGRQRQVLHDLRENEFALVHRRVPPGGAGPARQSAHFRVEPQPVPTPTTLYQSNTLF